jgi:hypothetical protein
MIVVGKKATGRPGMELWQMLVLGVVRLGLDANWDRREDLSNLPTKPETTTMRDYLLTAMATRFEPAEMPSGKRTFPRFSLSGCPSRIPGR